MKKYELFDHTADIGITVYGKNLNELFANAAYGMFDIIACLDKIKHKEQTQQIQFELFAFSFEDLMREWLSKLLLEFNIYQILPSKFDVLTSNEKYLKAIVSGEKLNFLRHKIKTEIKVITYHHLKLKKEKGIYKTQIIFDV